MPKASVRWNGDLKLVGKDQFGHEVLMEAHKRYGGSGEGTTPMDLFLMALGGCASLEIITMLKSRNQNLTSLDVELEGIRREEHPRFFSKISVKFKFQGALDDNIVDRVVRLTMTKLCPIAAMLSNISEMKWSYEISKTAQLEQPIKT
ncbi:MAG: OsmC family protein [Candidatus Methanomethyliaceae archaeon]|nr:OsmC family protein [Candidatus Methanomethyliaceae archaeon]